MYSGKYIKWDILKVAVFPSHDPVAPWSREKAQDSVVKKAKTALRSALADIT